MAEPEKCVCGGSIKISQSDHINKWFHGQCSNCQHHQQADSKEKVVELWNWFIGIAKEKKIGVDRFRTLARLWNDR